MLEKRNTDDGYCRCFLVFTTAHNIKDFVIRITNFDIPHPLCYYSFMLNGFPILNVFPDLLSLSFLAPMILRIALGVITINLGYLALRQERARWNTFFQGFGIAESNSAVTVFGLVEILGGVALVLGLYTQPAALIFAIINFVEMYAEYKESALVKRNIVFYILLFVIALSLLFTGAGAYSLDLPL